ncbi:TetR/AcrR family transcriptional regulator [Clostridium sp. B9]|uniref:TetR/AcrR family transcriptional regulator n=1 Tax=Clostridium sp. B9 TaxID=3423224 RepID=UPI003D2EAAE9
MPKIIKNVREDLLIEGKKQLLSNGYTNLNIRNITKECNIGTGTFYNYFKNKDKLVSDILTTDWNTILFKSNQIVDADISFKAKIEIISDNINEFLTNYRHIFSEMAKHSSKNHKIIDPMYDVIRRIINIHIKIGEINPPISSSKFSFFILNNLILISRSELTLNDLFLLLNI